MPLPTNMQQYMSLAFPFVLNASNGLLAYNLRDSRLIHRWLIGFSSLQMSILFWQKYIFPNWEDMLPPILNDPNIGTWWLLVNVTMSQWISNPIAGIFGGKKYYNKHGIDNIKKVIISSLCVGQTYFNKKTDNIESSQRIKSIRDLFKSILLFSTGYSICKYLSNNLSIKKQIESNPIIKIEFMKILFSLLIFVPNIPSIIHGIIFGGRNNEYELNIIKPYDFVYFTKSSRDFWAHWSKPMGEMLRYMVYEPLGGRNNLLLSVSALFAMNCSFHYNIFDTFYADKTHIYDWNKVFGLLSITLSIEMLLEHKYKKSKTNMIIKDNKKNSDIIPDNVLWQILCFGLVHMSMHGALKIITNKALIVDVNMSSMCNSFLFDAVFE